MPSLPVKVYRKDEIRRFRLETADDESHFGYNKLMKKIYRLFPISERSNVRLMWKDTDGEFVVMSTNSEFNEAVQNLPAEDKVLRVYVFETEDKDLEKQPEPEQRVEDQQAAQQEEKTDSEKEPEKEPVEEDPTLYRWVVCDGCEGEIRVIRFKCLTCPDYDLCSECIDKGIHDEHPMIRITSPKDATWHEAFVASQTFPFRIGFGRRFGSGRCHGRRCRRQAEAPAQEEAKKPEEQKEETSNEQTEPNLEFLTEDIIRDLTETMETVLTAIGIPLTAHATATSNPQTNAQSTATPSDVHPDPKIAAALNYMLAMGYKNDGGWLTSLLEEKRGNVSAVLDVLHPNPPK